MAGSAYIDGLLNTLVKSGAVTTAYAAGFREALEKEAFVGAALRLARPVARGVARFALKHPRITATGAGLVAADQGIRAMGQSDRFNSTLQQRNAAKGGTDSDIRLSREDTVDALNAARPWWDNLHGRALEWAASKVRPLKSLVPGNPKTWDQYVLDHENWQRADEQDYMRRANIEGKAGGPLGQWAVADLHARHSDIMNDLATGAKTWMPRSQRDALGLPDKPVNLYQTPYTQSAIDSGLYKLKNDYGDKPAATPPGYGRGLTDYGENAALFRDDSAFIRPRRP